MDDLTDFDDLFITLEGEIEKPPYPEYNEEKDEFLSVHAHRLREKEKHETSTDHFPNIPNELKMTNVMIYGQSLAQCIIHQLISNDADALWSVLAYIMHEIYALHHQLI